ncbi:DUF4926 domain-containing protein [candidate division KSB1 bacterium]|nr:DUF4926 domain-containing protein [candidate division KSB1 bacterium]
MIRELDSVALACDIAEHGLKQGDIGAVVHCYGDGLAFEVEFVTAAGKTITVLTLSRDEIRPLGGREILHARELEQTLA